MPNTLATELVTESTRVVEATPVAGQPGRFLIGLINSGWGSSGYYSPAVLEAAAKDRVFPAGTHMYLDHPTESEQYERPERSIRDLAAVLASDAVWDGEQLVAEATVFGGWREALTQMREAIGASIRAAAEVTEGGEAEGRRGRIIDRLVEAQSVDFVTHAGRGGKILAVIESARRRQVEEARNIGQWVESRIHRDFTMLADDMAGEGRLTREERIGMSSAIGDALAAFVASLEANHPQLYQRDLWDDPTDTIAAATEAATNVPTTPAGSSSTTTSEEDAMPDRPIDQGGAAAATEAAPTTPAAAETTSVTEATTETPGTTPATPAATPAAGTSSHLEENTMPENPGAGGSAPQSPRQIMEARLAEQGRQIAEMRAQNRARDIVAEVLAGGWIGEQQRARLTGHLLASVPLTEAHELDEPALRTRTTEALEAAETEAAEILQAAGYGTPRGLGALSTPATEAAGKQAAEGLTESFKVFGLSDTAAKTAVKGR